jgi:Amt family ammonium transporter
MFSMTEVLSGTLAGLAAITPGSGFVGPQAAALVGAIAGTASFLSSRFLRKQGVDDVLDCFSLQAVPGIVGILLTAPFCST